MDTTRETTSVFEEQPRWVSIRYDFAARFPATATNDAMRPELIGAVFLCQKLQIPVNEPQNVTFTMIGFWSRALL